MRLFYKGVILISLSLAFEIFFALQFVDLLHQSRQQPNLEVRVKEVISRVERIQTLITESTTIAGLNRQLQDFLLVGIFGNLLTVLGWQFFPEQHCQTLAKPHEKYALT